MNLIKDLVNKFRRNIIIPRLSNVWNWNRLLKGAIEVITINTFT